MADENKSAAVIDRKADPGAEIIIEQRKESQRWLNQNYYPEWREVYRTSKARVEKRIKRRANGNEEEDKTRTNICFPDHFVMVRHGVARLTRNPPNLRMRGADRLGAEKMAALQMYQWDKSESQISFRKVVHAGKMLGIGIGKTYYDKSVITRQFKKSALKLTAKELMRLREAPQDEIDDVDDEAVPTQGELSSAAADFGDIVTLPTPITKFEGCILASVFPGDFFPEPGYSSFAEASYKIENSVRDEDWLEYWTKQVTTDPDTGEEQPIISEKAAADLMEMAGAGRNTLDKRDTSLRRQMREAVNLADPNTYNTSTGGTKKKFVIDERHTIEDGSLVIEYVGEENLYLGKQWYPYCTYGRDLYSELVLIPDLLGGIGDSTPRISKFLMQMRNNRGNQTNDFLNNVMLPLVKVLEGSTYGDEDLQRTAFARLVTVKNMSDLDAVPTPEFPQAGWEEQASLTREMQQIEPAMSDFAPGTEAIPQAGKLATTAVLQQKSADSILADELGQLNSFVRNVMELWRDINQQAISDDVTINKGDVGRVDMLMLGMEGKPEKITISALDIQQEMQVLPEAGSTLAADDDYKVKALQQGLQLAGAFPDVLDTRYFATELVKAMPGVNPEQAIKPPQPPPPPPPPKINIGLAIKWADLNPDAQVAILKEMNLPTADTATLGLVHHATEAVKKISDAADAADNLQSAASSKGPGEDGEPKVPTPAGMKGEMS